MLGITDDHVAAIGSDGYMDSPLLTPREKATVLWAEHVTRNTAKVRDDVAEEVQRHFTDAEFVELTFVISYFNMRNRYHDSLKLPNDEAEIVEGRRKATARPGEAKGVPARGAGQLAGRLPRAQQVEDIHGPRQRGEPINGPRNLGGMVRPSRRGSG